LNAALAIAILHLISQVHLPSFVKMIPKYLKDSTFSILARKKCKMIEGDFFSEIIKFYDPSSREYFLSLKGESIWNLPEIYFSGASKFLFPSTPISMLYRNEGNENFLTTMYDLDDCHLHTVTISDAA
jgi:hypothetical protein